jgi:FkbM family methyltransferase
MRAKTVLRVAFEKMLDISFSRKSQIWLAEAILFRAKGEVNDNPNTNGEIRLQREIGKRIKGKQGVVFDVGANIGEWSRELVRNWDEELIMYAFEPSKETFSELTKLELSTDSKVFFRPFNLALSNRNGEENLHISEQLAGTNSIHKRYFGPEFPGQELVEKVGVIRGDSFCEEQGIEHIDFVKIDTEGHEMAVLAGFETMLDNRRIDYIQFEYGGTWIDSRHFLIEAFQFFGSRGYQIAKIHSRGIEPFEHYQPKQETFAGANYMAIREDLVAGLERIE